MLSQPKRNTLNLCDNLKFMGSHDSVKSHSLSFNIVSYHQNLNSRIFLALPEVELTEEEIELADSYADLDDFDGLDISNSISTPKSAESTAYDNHPVGNSSDFEVSPIRSTSPSACNRLCQAPPPMNDLNYEEDPVDADEVPSLHTEGVSFNGIPSEAVVQASMAFGSSVVQLTVSVSDEIRPHKKPRLDCDCGNSL